MPAIRAGELTVVTPVAEQAGRALVPVASSIQWAPPVRLPDPTFVTQLIASAQRSVERRRWPRDRAADARSAYRAGERHGSGTGINTRQMI